MRDCWRYGCPLPGIFRRLPSETFPKTAAEAAEKIKTNRRAAEPKTRGEAAVGLDHFSDQSGSSPNGDAEAGPRPCRPPPNDKYVAQSVTGRATGHLLTDISWPVMLIQKYLVEYQHFLEATPMKKARIYLKLIYPGLALHARKHGHCRVFCKCTFGWLANRWTKSCLWLLGVRLQPSRIPKKPTREADDVLIVNRDQMHHRDRWNMGSDLLVISPAALLGRFPPSQSYIHQCSRKMPEAR